MDPLRDIYANISKPETKKVDVTSYISDRQLTNPAAASSRSVGSVLGSTVYSTRTAAITKAETDLRSAQFSASSMQKNPTGAKVHIGLPTGTQAQYQQRVDTTEYRFK